MGWGRHCHWTRTTTRARDIDEQKDKMNLLSPEVQHEREHEPYSLKDIPRP